MMRKPVASGPMIIHDVDPDSPRRRPLLDSRRMSAATNTSDPPDLEHRLALVAPALAEPVRGHDGDHGHADGDRDGRNLHGLGAAVDYATELAELGFEIGACDGRLRLR